MIHTRIERAIREAKSQGELVDRDAVLTELRRHDLHDGGGWQNLFGTGGGHVKDEQVQATVRRELDRYQADGLAVPDYALLTAGARVVPRLTSDTYTPGLGADAGRIRRVAWWLLSQLKPPVAKPASVALLPWRHPGDCWPMAGRSGRITVHLAKAIIPEAITLEHVDRRIALDATSSPKHLVVYAWLWDDKQGAWTKPLIRFNYQLNGPAAQTFSLSPDVVGSFPVRLIQLRILDNYGQPDFTCLYRFRVHGRTISSKTTAASTPASTSTMAAT
ncbi:UNC-like C-terminal-domain-containing protein [Syncephalis pseudoplumigaleata]|uniref:UNC-like C-terminal-domain-containing protein n=1 Tax=Syncephalis pseudoplumigaleata TaxID=1712513 RepID=A0A4P9YVE1_9FUNG|nr:UNC-like C-terminal-domain-containing protein [Syncephalis pseudoplumigaleata]|eukprot:RKP23996.1 UNC-like C-terminal-domain-containing protein [Syncephalis pseudoplumigaleata]